MQNDIEIYSKNEFKKRESACFFQRYTREIAIRIMSLLLAFKTSSFSKFIFLPFYFVINLFG